MKCRFFRLVVFVFLIPAVNFNCASYSSSLNNTLSEYTQLSGINTLFNQAGGLNNLMGKGNKSFTILAPSNNALAKLGPGTVESLLKPGNKQQLIGLLQKHIVPGKNNADSLRAGHLKDILGNEVSLGGANISETIQTKGGIIHVIDKVIQ